MTTTDPFGLANVPFVGREVDRWLEIAESIATDSGGNLGRWIDGLHRRGKPRYFWDAHFTFIVAWSALTLADWRPLSALAAIAAFGHDTDSYAQLVGALGGAVAGRSWIPSEWQTAVGDQLKDDYRTDWEEWIDQLK